MSKEKRKGRWLFFGKDKYTYDTIDELVNKSMGLAPGEVVTLNGYYSADDGATHKRVIADTDDGSGVQLRSGKWANIVHNGEVNVSWFGAKGDGVTDDTEAIQKALNNSKIITFNKVYKIFNNIEVTSDSVIKGVGKIIGSSQQGYLKEILIKGNNIEIKNLNFEYTGIRIIQSCENVKIDKCRFENFGMAIGCRTNIPYIKGLMITNNLITNQISSTATDMSKYYYHSCIGFLFVENLINITIENNIISKTNSFGIEFYNSEKFSKEADKVTISNNLIEYTGFHRKISDNYSGCGGIYNNVYNSGISVLYNTIRYINEVGIEGPYDKVIGNTVEETGYYSKDKFISDNSCIYGKSKNISNNILINPGNSGCIHYFSRERNDNSNILISGNKFINTYVNWVSEKEYSLNDFVIIDKNVYKCVKSGVSSSLKPIISDKNNLQDGSCEWEYHKELCKNIFNFNQLGGIIINNNFSKNFEYLLKNYNSTNNTIINNKLENVKKILFSHIFSLQEENILLGSEFLLISQNYVLDSTVTPIFGELDIEQKVSNLVRNNESKKIIQAYDESRKKILIIEIECFSDGVLNFYITKESSIEISGKPPINAWSKITIIYEIENNTDVILGYSKELNTNAKIKSIRTRVLSF